MAADKLKAQEARELYVLKQKAIKYYEENGVPQRMEEILNSTFYDTPNDVYGHIANFFEKHAVTPTITKICSREVFDSGCRPSVQAEVYCMIKNFEKLVCTLTGSSLPSKIDPCSLKGDEKQQFEETRQQAISDLSNMLKNSINDQVCGCDPCAQSEIDEKMTGLVTKLREELQEKAKQYQNSEVSEAQTSPAQSPNKGKKSPKGKPGKGGKEVAIIPDDVPEETVCGCEAVSLASRAICQAAASVNDVPLYEHIARLRHKEVPSTLKLPLPMATILYCGKQFPGKLNYVSEFMVVPKPNMPFCKAYKSICKIYHHCAQALSAKTGAITRNVNDLGALCPPYDRTEQGLDLLQEAITAIGLTPAEDFNIMLQLAGPECFDYEKGKYEITVGGLKAAEDLADYWGDITTKYPSVIGIIDPMRRVEKAAWMKLCERVTETCHVMCDVTGQRAGLFNVTEILPDWRFSGMVLNAHGQNTISELIQSANKLEDDGCEVMVGTSPGVSSTFSVDLAIGLQARFLKLGAPMRGERIALFNHLLQIEDQLTHSAMIDTWVEHQFTLIKPPTPPPETEDEDADAASPTKDKKV